MPGLRLDAEELSFQVGRLTILHPFSFTLLPGEFVGVLGPSGCGKSTLLNLLSGQLKPSSGQLLYDGGLPQEKHRKQVGFVPQDDIVHTGLSVQKALLYSARLRMRSDLDAGKYNEAVDHVIERLELQERRKTRVSKLSGGQRKRVNIGVELLTEPLLLFLDEPTAGLDPALEEKFMEFCSQLAGRGRSLVMTTHILQSLELFDLLIVLSAGHLVFIGSPEQLLDHFQVDQAQALYKLLNREQAPRQAQDYLKTPYHMEYVRERRADLQD